MRLTAAGRLAGIAAVLMVVATAPGARTAVALVRGDDFPAAARGAVHLGSLGVACWALLVILTGLAHLPVPGASTRVGAMLFTTVIVAGVSSPAQAESARDLQGLILPDRPMMVRATSTVTVNPGDTLWGIAADHLPDHSSAADIASSSARWYATNRHVIGPDPDHIVPGQDLALPPTTDPATHDQDAP
ncbi:MAG: LysM domain-containing protein [Aeromicrobium sp.]|uniref:LysM peptidoglycan-binding domain-containing protein n=1 Tax=Aeromicrobium sp. TaxID=1871063 RepID=UPI003C5CD7DE